MNPVWRNLLLYDLLSFLILHEYYWRITLHLEWYLRHLGLSMKNFYLLLSHFSLTYQVFPVPKNQNLSMLGVIFVVKSPDFVPKAVDTAAKELIAIASPGQVSQVQLDRAKKSTKSAVLMNLESRMIASEDIGRQILAYGERKPLELFLKAVDEITLNDITKIAQKIISSPLTMASYGDGN